MLSFKGAVISECRQYRYTLLRANAGMLDHRVLWVMLNPSTADSMHNDPTINRVADFSEQWGFYEFTVVNLYAFRTPYPKLLKAAADPIGPENDVRICHEADRATMIVAAWGQPGPIAHRATDVLRMLRGFKPVHCLKRNKTGHPTHPLYQPKHLTPQVLAA